MSAYLEITDGVAVLNLGDHENRFSPGWLSAAECSLERIDSGDAKAPPPW
jgi:hypothetical protein